MTLADLTLKLQTLCHEGHSLDEVVIDGKEVNEKLHNNLGYLVTKLEKYEMNEQEADTDGKEESDTEN